MKPKKKKSPKKMVVKYPYLAKGGAWFQTELAAEQHNQHMNQIEAVSEILTWGTRLDGCTIRGIASVLVVNKVELIKALNR